MIKKLYWFYRKERLSSPYELWNNLSLNWNYSISFFASNMYADYVKAGVIAIKDQEIPTDRYIKEIVPGIKDLREFVTYEYNLDYVDESLMLRIIWKIGQRFDLEILDVEQAKTFIRKQTNLEEVTEWKFKLSDETTGIDWQAVPAKFLIIE